MASLLTAYWMGLAAADSARASQDMWDLATRATRRRQIPVDNRSVLIAQVAQLETQLQQALAERDTNYRAWLEESALHKQTQAELDTVMSTWYPF